jgi:hypothetical protein
MLCYSCKGMTQYDNCKSIIILPRYAIKLIILNLLARRTAMMNPIYISFSYAPIFSTHVRGPGGGGGWYAKSCAPRLKAKVIVVNLRTYM